MVGVTKGLGDDAPCLIPFQPLQIDQDPLQLDDGQGGMRVVQLDPDLVGELPPRSLGLLEPTDDVVERGGHPEVLLLQSKLLSSLQIIVRVQHRRDGLRPLLIRHSVLILARVELLKVKLPAAGLARP